MTHKKTSREIFIEKLNAHKENLKKYFDIEDETAKENYAVENIGEPLAITEQIELKIELSWGGPADGFLVYLDPETRTPISGKYYFADWGTYEEENLLDDELELVCSFYGTSAT